MPARDGTGPEGKGEKTGRGLGNCDGVPRQQVGTGTRSRLNWFGRLFLRRRAGNGVRGRRKSRN